LRRSCTLKCQKKNQIPCMCAPCVSLISPMCVPNTCHMCPSNASGVSQSQHVCRSCGCTPPVPSHQRQ
jgi:hypothetical protein